MIYELLATYCIMVVFVILRADHIHKIRMRALKEVFSREDWMAQREAFHNGPGFFEMLFDLTRWRFRSFYPNLWREHG